MAARSRLGEGGFGAAAWTGGEGRAPRCGVASARRGSAPSSMDGRAGAGFAAPGVAASISARRRCAAAFPGSTRSMLRYTSIARSGSPCFTYSSASVFVSSASRAPPPAGADPLLAIVTSGGEAWGAAGTGVGGTAATAGRGAEETAGAGAETGDADKLGIGDGAATQDGAGAAINGGTIVAAEAGLAAAAAGEVGMRGAAATGAGETGAT